jgi:Glyoxalase-like domain
VATTILVDPDGVRPRIWFQPVPKSKVVKNRVHLDLGVSGGRRVPLAAAGATCLRVLSEEAVDPLRGGHGRPRGQRVLPHLRGAG